MKCVNETGVFVSRTRTVGVKCQCDYGYQLNITSCIPIIRTHKAEPSESVVAIVLGVLGGVVAVVSVALVVYMKIRRNEWMNGENVPDAPSAKNQPTMEITKEMEIRSSTGTSDIVDAERTGEISYKP